MSERDADYILNAFRLRVASLHRSEYTRERFTLERARQLMHEAFVSSGLSVCPVSIESVEWGEDGEPKISVSVERWVDLEDARSGR